MDCVETEAVTQVVDLRHQQSFRSLAQLNTNRTPD
jgi:hypothetical protein